MNSFKLRLLNKCQKIQVKVGSHRVTVFFHNKTTAKDLTQMALQLCKIRDTQKNYELFERSRGVERTIDHSQTISILVSTWTKNEVFELIIRKSHVSQIMSESIMRTTNQIGNSLYELKKANICTDVHIYDDILDSPIKSNRSLKSTHNDFENTSIISKLIKNEKEMNKKIKRLIKEDNNMLRKVRQFKKILKDIKFNNKESRKSNIITNYSISNHIFENPEFKFDSTI